MSDVVKTEVHISEASIKQIVASEIAKGLIANEKAVQGMIHAILNAKTNSYGSESVFDSVLKKAIEPMVQEEIIAQAETIMPAIRSAIKKAFGDKVKYAKDIEKAFVEAMARNMSGINVYFRTEN